VPRQKRADYPGAYHHAMNRGVGRRTTSDDDQEIRLFLSGVAEAVRAGLIEVHAFVVMLTHFHLLVRSKVGRLGEAMKLVEERYAQRFNWRRDRRGPLFQGRFRSELIQSPEYWENVVRYIDRNPVRAGIVARPEDYPFGSARAYVANRRPAWLTTSVVDTALRGASISYRQLSDGSPNPAMDLLIERRLADTRAGFRGLDTLLGNEKGILLAIMDERCRQADGTTVVRDRLPPDVVDIACKGRPREDAEVASTRAGLLRALSGITFTEIARRLGVSRTQAYRLSEAHLLRMKSEPDYATRMTDLVGRLLAGFYGKAVVRPDFIREMGK
jgi:REP element-mobilizing transposase RayT